jgi:uncharacterized SAM-binding protein YcdF (DUF218 family)
MRRARRALAGLAFVACFIAAAWIGRDWCLREAAKLWIVSDEVGPADVAVVLGGGLSVRPIAAAEYYHEGFIKKILVPNVGLDQSELLGVVPTHTSLIHGALIKLGIPETAIITFGSNVQNTHQEVAALREWAIQNHAQSVIVPTEEFTSRRLHWMLEHEFAGTGVKTRVIAIDPSEYRWDTWWHNTHGILAFQNEIIKYVYYRFKYRTAG